MPGQSLKQLADNGVIDSSWVPVLQPVATTIAQLGDRLRAEQDAGRRYAPTGHNVLRAFRQPFSAVRVLILGQDPYPTPGHAVGLSFSVHPEVQPLPRSLNNIYRELHDDLGISPAGHGDLSAWTEQGVLLLNRVLTVQERAAGSHRGWGWEEVTGCAVQALASRGMPLVAVLWGNDARAAVSLLGTTATVSSAHPSPLSAHRGFFGSRPFSRVNDLLRQQSAPPVDWQLPAINLG
ncbi:uracil-DNA glycosylase [Microbacterium sp. YY-01]|uniref:uracil-DNA glycosylase n=1 Tax=Microbacterium sp. YY-01 TaxID=3421634 RepID=UPI003D163968